MYWYLMGSLLMGFLGMGAFLYYYYKGQFENDEDVKYQMFRDE
jgi:nitrogen fixation-related uncharacterized protein